MSRALIFFAALLLAVPGFFVGAKGLAAMRRRSVVVQGREVAGRKALAAGAILVVYGLAMIGIAAVLVVSQLGR